MTAVQISIHSKHFAKNQPTDQQPVIANLDLTLESGEFVCLVGPSGCGKTTLLNIVAGLDEAFQGKITLAQAHTRPTIGYVFQNPRLLPWRSVRENIDLAARTTPEIIDALLLTMNLSGIQNAYPEHLSLGMQRRIAIIRAFAVDPDILLLDEPFVSLDAPTARQVRQLLLQLWQERPHIVLFVTHDLREAITLADRLVFLSSSPMQLLKEIPVTIARNERQDETRVEAFRQQLFSSFPEIASLL